jgi:hypothetical protein
VAEESRVDEHLACVVRPLIAMGIAMQTSVLPQLGAFFS